MTIAKDPQRGMSPFADMLNHELDAAADWAYSDDRLGFTVKSIRDIAKGTEITESYGDKSNHDFYLDYGFHLP